MNCLLLSIDGSFHMRQYHRSCSPAQTVCLMRAVAACLAVSMRHYLRQQALCLGLNVGLRGACICPTRDT